MASQHAMGGQGEKGGEPASRELEGPGEEAAFEMRNEADEQRLQSMGY